MFKADVLILHTFMLKIVWISRFHKVLEFFESLGN